MSNLIENNTNYYFKSAAVSVYPCAYRGANDKGKFFDPASRYTSEKNITSAAVGLVPTGTYISDIPLEIPQGESSIIWKFTIGGYNFEVQLTKDDLEKLAQTNTAVKFEIKPEVLPNDATTDDSQDKLISLGKVLTSYEVTADTAAQLSILDRKLSPDQDYCFTGLQVTLSTEDVTLQPTSTQLIPVLSTTVGANTALVLNQCARLPEITHGREEGEAEVTKLTILENITLADADAKDLLVKDQFVVGTNRDDGVILKVTLDRNQATGVAGTPSIEINEAPVTINTDTDESTTKALSVAGGAEIKKSLTVAGNAMAGALSVADNKFVVSTAGSTTLKNNLTVKNGEAEKFKVDASNGNTVIAGTLGIKGDLNVNTNKFNVSADNGNTKVAGTFSVTGDLRVNTDKFSVEATGGNTSVAGTLNVGPNDNRYLIVASDGTVSNTNSFTAKSIVVTNDTESNGPDSGALKVAGGVGIGKNLNVGGNLSAGNISSTVASAETNGTTLITGDVTVKNSTDNDMFSITNTNTTNTKTTIATSATEIQGDAVIAGPLKVTQDFTINPGEEVETTKFNIDATTGNTTIAGGLNVNGQADLTTLEVSGAGDEAVNITTGGLSVKGKIMGKGALEVDGAATVPSLNIKSKTVIDSIRNLLNINNATVNTLRIVADDVSATEAALTCSGKLIAKSVEADALYVPNHTGGGHSTLSLGPKVTNDDGIATRSFYFSDGAGEKEYVITHTVAKTALLDMIYPVGSIYMSMKNVSPADTFGGTWARISQGRVLLGASDAGGSFSVGATGGYYDPQPWAHWHQYNAANASTNGCRLEMKHLPRKNFGLQFYIAQSGGDKENILRWCGGSGLDGYNVKGAPNATSNARLGGTQVYSGNKNFRETEGYWNFHYGTDGTQVEHLHGITSSPSNTTGYRTSSSPTVDGNTLSNGNLPPYLVCYIWQRTK